MTTALAKQSEQRLAKYDPAKGVKKIAVAEMAVKHWAKAKDTSQLLPAIRSKLEHQADFVLWWKTKGPGASHGVRLDRRDDRSDISISADAVAEQLGTSVKQISRWRAKLDDPANFERVFEQACAKYSKILEFDTTAHVGQNTGETEWFTPAEYIEAARLVLGDIDLDPATTEEANAVVKAAQILTAKDDGLTQRWDGRVWMNPPYAQPLVTQFCEKLADTVRAGTVPAAVVLVNNATETHWFRAVVDVASAICFPTGRVRFWHPTKASATPLQGQAVLYVGPNVDAFFNAFHDFGFVVEIRR